MARGEQCELLTLDVFTDSAANAKRKLRLSGEEQGSVVLVAGMPNF